jgi:S1-C subfamily serine protease
VQFNDGQQLTAEVVGIDPPNDLAVLRVANMPQLTPLPIGDSSNLRVGQRAIAIGNPFGLDSTLTTGVISALGRPLQISQDQYIYNVIQTDAAINPGNSGGPLLNSRGELIGVNTAIRQGAEGIGFAVPAEIVQRVVPVLIETGRYPHPWLGLLGYSITPDLAQALELPVESGILIAQLYQDGPAVKAGVRGATQEAILGYQRLLIGGDILTAINGEPVQNWNQLQQYLQTQTQVGDEVSLTLMRDGQTFTQTLTLEAQP